MSGKSAKARRLADFLGESPQTAADILRRRSVRGTRLDRKPVPTVNRAFRLLMPYAYGPHDRPVSWN